MYSCAARGELVGSCNAVTADQTPLKRSVRERLRSVRRELSPWVIGPSVGNAVAARAAGSDEFLSAEGIFTYLAEENEVPTWPLIDRAAQNRILIFLPCFVGGEWTLKRWFPGEALERGKFGLWQPLATAPDLDARQVRSLVAYVPLVAWASTGARVGRGAGVYDRLLARLRARVALQIIGLGYEFQNVPGLTMDSWDVPLDKVITERRTVACTCRGAGIEERST